MFYKGLRSSFSRLRGSDAALWRGEGRGRLMYNYVRIIIKFVYFQFDKIRLKYAGKKPFYQKIW